VDVALAVHITPFGVDHVVVALGAVIFVICGVTVIADVAVDGAVAGAVRSGSGVEKLTYHSPISRASAPDVYVEIAINRKYV
jgi:hypothetical protein